MSRFEYVRRFFQNWLKERNYIFYVNAIDRVGEYLWGLKAANFFIKTFMKRSQTKIME